MEYLLAHDLGTSGNKTSLYSADGVLVRSVTVSYGTHYFNQNWAEQNPQDWWAAVCQGTKKVLDGISKGDVLGVSFSGQMQGCVCVDKQGDVLRPAIIWADQRSVKENDDILRQISAHDFYHITGHRASQSYSMQKLMWLKTHEENVYQDTEKMLNCKDYIILKMTGQFVTDYSDASGTNLLDLNRMQWSEELLEYAGILMDKLPRILQSSDIAGYVTGEAAVQTGLLEGTPVVTGGGDGACAAVGAGCVRPGQIYSCIGTSAWIGAAADEPIYDPDMRTFNFAHMVPGLISPCGTMQSGGASYQWMLKAISHMTQRSDSDIRNLIEEGITQSPAGANGLIFLPYLMGERSPRWNADAKGCIIGLTLEHTCEDMMRSVLEGVAFNLDLILDCFKKQIPAKSLWVMGGGAKNKQWLQIMADIYGIPLRRLNLIEEATSLGAAVAAGVGVGVFSDFEVVSELVCQTEEIFPRAEQMDLYRSMKPIFNDAYESLGSVYKSLSEIGRRRNEIIR